MSLETLDGTGAQDEQLGFRVEGMDCASCVGKIETALGRIDGVSNVSSVRLKIEQIQLVSGG